MYLSFFAAERAQYADIRCSVNFTLVLSNIKKKNHTQTFKNADWNNYTQKIDNEDNWCLTHAEIFKSKIHLWLFFLLACPNYCHMPCSNAKILTVSALDGIL